MYGQADPRSKKGAKKNVKKAQQAELASRPVDPKKIEEFMHYNKQKQQFDEDEHDDHEEEQQSRDRDLIYEERINQASKTKRKTQQQHQHQHQHQHQFNQFTAQQKSEEDYVNDLESYHQTQQTDSNQAAQSLKMATMSKSEREFLMRRGAPAIETNNIMMSATEPLLSDPNSNSNKNTNYNATKNQPQFPNPVMHQSLDNIPGFGSQTKYNSSASNSGSSEVVNAMRSRIDEMEKEINSLKHKAKGAEEAAIHASVRAKEANKKLSTSQAKFTRAMQEKDDEHSRSLLGVGSDLNASKAEVAELRTAMSKSNQSNPFNNGSKNPDGSTSSFQQEMLKKVESLHKELSENQRRWNEEKRQLISEQAAQAQKLSAAHRQVSGRSELALMKTRILAMNPEKWLQT